MTWWRTYPWVGATIAVGVIGLILAWLAPPIYVQVLVSAFALIVAADQLRDMIADLRSGAWGIDILAIVAICATVAVGEYWAALVVCLMLSGGEALEDYASARARSELTGVLERAPSRAHVVDGDEVRTVAIGEVAAGDVLLIRPSEIVPVDGELLDARASVDESSLTGESLPVSHARGEEIMSGSINGSSAIHVRALASAADSKYQQIVALVQEAAASRSPMVRLADRIALPFTIFALAVAGIGWWISGEPLRAAQVLVVATPCPLLIAAPVAFMAGMSRAARAGIIVKDGGTIERLSRIATAAFDKTGTLTRGTPAVVAVQSENGISETDLLAAAGAVEDYSTHPLARAIVATARERGIELERATDASEVVAAGFEGRVAGRHVAVGKASWIAEVAHVSDAELERVREHVQPGVSLVYVAIDGTYAGAIALADQYRPEATRTIAELRRLGIDNVLMLSGDTPPPRAISAPSSASATCRAACCPRTKSRP